MKPLPLFFRSLRNHLSSPNGPTHPIFSSQVFVKIDRFCYKTRKQRKDGFVDIARTTKLFDGTLPEFENIIPLDNDSSRYSDPRL